MGTPRKLLSYCGHMWILSEVSLSFVIDVLEPESSINCNKLVNHNDVNIYAVLLIIFV